MNNITMIPLGMLEHHPENPRKDLGDLTELADSIRKNGVMQNLTVIANQETSKYTVVIGNRRMEAAKIAGLAEVPCVISDMDHKTQVATMLMENMQRQDLTVFEQAQGFQMMMDLGFSVKEIGEKTGFGETTVRRRIKMAEMDPKLLKKACETPGEERQITMFDFDQLAQVESIKKRNELLKMIGERNFEWNLKRTIREQRASAVKNDVLKEVEKAGIKPLKAEDEYSCKYERLWNNNVDLADWQPGEKLIPDSEEQLYYLLKDTEIKFYMKAKKPEKEKAPEKTEAEKRKEREIDTAWKIADRITQASAERRREFAEGLTVKPSTAMQMLRWTIIAGLSDLINHNYSTYTALKKKMDIHGDYYWSQTEDLEQKIMAKPQGEWPSLILIMFEGCPGKGDKAESFASGYRKDWPQFMRNTRLEQCYKWLTEFGYQMSDEEIQMMAGTHECFGKKGKK